MQKKVITSLETLEKYALLKTSLSILDTQTTVRTYDLDPTAPKTTIGKNKRKGAVSKPIQQIFYV